MAYTAAWDETVPLGTAAANTIDDLFRNLKRDLRERIADYLMLPSASAASFATDPLRPYGLKFTDSADAKLTLGDNAGTPRSLLIRNKADTTTYYTFAYNAFTLASLPVSGITTLAIGGAFSGATTGAFSSNVTVGGTLGVTGAVTLTAALSVGTTLGVTGAATFSSTVATGALTVTGAATISTTLGVTGNTTIGGTLGVTGQITGNLTGNVTGNASTATTLQTARTIWGQSFNGSANVSGALTGVSTIDASGNILTTADLVAGAARWIAWFGRTQIHAPTDGGLTIETSAGVDTLTLSNAGLLTVTSLAVGATTLSSALTYGGVTLSNSVTGTGSMVLSASPTFTGTVTTATVSVGTSGAGANISLHSSSAGNNGIARFFLSGVEHGQVLATTGKMALYVVASIALDIYSGNGVALAFDSSQVGTFAKGFSVTSGTTAVQALTATTTTLSGKFTVSGSISGDDTVLIRNQASDGYSSVHWQNNSGAAKLSIGFGNPTVGITELRGKAYVYTQTGIGFDIFVDSDTTAALSIATTNAATFSSSVTATDHRIDSGGYATSISQDGTGFYITHNSAIRSLTFGVNGSRTQLVLPTAGGITTDGGITATTGTFTSSVVAGAAFAFGWTGRSSLTSASDGVIMLSNSAGSDFSRLQFGGTTSSFPALKRNSARIDVRLADDSGYAEIVANKFSSDAGGVQINGGATVTQWLTAATAWDPASIPSGSTEVKDVTVTGAAVGDLVCVDNPYTADNERMVMTGRVSAADTVRLVLYNASGIAVDCASRTPRILVFKF